MFKKMKRQYSKTRIFGFFTMLDPVGTASKLMRISNPVFDSKIQGGS